MERGERALAYHERTKHSFESVRTTPHFLDWANQPIPFKIYRDLEAAPLPPAGEPDGLSAFKALAASKAEKGEGKLTAPALSRLLFHAAGITKRLRRGGGERLFRAAACTGALYHVDLYVAAEAFDGFDAGVYHYDPRGHALSCLRRGDWRSTLVSASGEEEHVAGAGAVVVLASTYWRNAWKYRARAYRHVFWDGGTILANLLAEARVLDLPAYVVLGFADGVVERLLGLDPDKEGAFALVALSEGGEPPPAPAANDAIEPLELRTEPLSPEEVDYPLVRETHAAGALADGEVVASWRDEARAAASELASRDDEKIDEKLEGVAEPPGEPLEKVIRRRGSARRFLREPIDGQRLASVLEATREPASADAFPEGRTWCDLYVIVNDVGGIDPGAYVYHAGTGGLELLKAGDFRKEAAYLDLEQDHAGDASANVYVLADLDAVVERLGARGYRVAELEGGLLGGRMYLAAYALGLAATGLTFYDDAVTEFFSPHGSGKSVMFLFALGVRGERRALFET